MKIILLSQQFYAQYEQCIEILDKENRPYACLEVAIDGQLFAIPIRHHIRHAYAFITIGDAGLDYSKAVLLSDEKYISPREGRIDSEEWKILKRNENKIFSQFRRYLKQYKRALRYPDNPRSKMILRYSALQYFDITP